MSHTFDRLNFSPGWQSIRPSGFLELIFHFPLVPWNVSDATHTSSLKNSSNFDPPPFAPLCFPTPPCVCWPDLLLGRTFFGSRQIFILLVAVLFLPRCAPPLREENQALLAREKDAAELRSLLEQKRGVSARLASGAEAARVRAERAESQAEKMVADGVSLR